MSRKWGARSAAHLATCDEDIIWLMTTLRDEVADISILQGHRGKDEQDEYYATGASTVPWPQSKHNRYPSQAVDFQPYPVPAREVEVWAALGYLAGRAIEIGKRRGLVIRWGGDWDMDGDLADNRFDDLYHLEIVRDD